MLTKQVACVRAVCACCVRVLCARAVCACCVRVLCVRAVCIRAVCACYFANISLCAPFLSDSALLVLKCISAASSAKYIYDKGVVPLEGRKSVGPGPWPFWPTP